MISSLSLLISLLLSLSFICASPSLYVTYHGGGSGVNTVYSYGLDGSLITSSVLVGDKEGEEYRSMMVAPDGTLLLAAANKDNSHISLFSNCTTAAKHTRNFVKYLVPDGTPSLQHPYGLSQTSSSPWYFFVSNQDDSSVVVYDSTGALISTVAQLSSDDVRGIAFDAQENVLYICDETTNSVLAYSFTTNSFNQSMSLSVSKPISLLLDAGSRTLFVSSNDDNSPAVISYDLTQQQIINKYDCSSYGHPTGMVLHNGILYVLSQDAQALITFDASSAEFRSQLIQNMPDVPEQLILSEC